MTKGLPHRNRMLPVVVLQPLTDGDGPIFVSLRAFRYIVLDVLLIVMDNPYCLITRITSAVTIKARQR